MSQDQRIYKAAIVLFFATICYSFITIHRIDPVVISPTISSNAPSISTEQQSFIHYLAQDIRQANVEIYRTRQTVQALYQKFQKQGWLSDMEFADLEKIAANYQTYSLQFATHNDWQQLLLRINIIPTSLALAQAANESAWGQSRFAQLANNYFGQWCYGRHCGIVPERRSPSQSHEVKRFASQLDSVKAYMHNLNTHTAYERFREVRANLIASGEPLQGILLASSLDAYNPNGQRYVNKLRHIIQHYSLQNYDIMQIE